ncbi:MAG TPA: PQQ-binding-like beta-propeller repeat protein [Caulobacteraceae bacterium]|nr:PQQ-binding-like beta-propeller repeat protein [Caulobacteraceae bacterium]
MSKSGRLGLPLALLLLASSAHAQTPARDWTTWGYDQQRTGWNQGETTLGKANVSKLKLLWTSQLAITPNNEALSSLTAPLVVEGVDVGGAKKDLVFLLSADDSLFALDADSGKPVWQKTFPNPAKPQHPADTSCSNTAQDTPVIDKARGLIFFIASDGKLRAAHLSDGSEAMRPTPMLAAFARAWSLNLIDDVIYTPSGRGCGNLDPNSSMAKAAVSEPFKPGGAAVLLEPSSIAAMDVHDLAHPSLTRFYTSGGRPNGAWGRGGVVKADRGIIAQTADGPIDPAAGLYGLSFVKLAPRVTRLLDSYTPANFKHLNTYDLDLGSGSATVFPLGKRTVAAGAGKEGALYVLDVANLGGADHATPLYRSPLLGNDAASGTEPGQGVWGATSTYLTPEGRRFVYIPMRGPPSKEAPAFKFNNGPIPNGSIMAYEVTDTNGAVALTAQWSSPDMIVPDPPVIANGVVYAVQTGDQALLQRPAKDGVKYSTKGPEADLFRATPVGPMVLWALDAQTGKPLYNSGKLITGWTHFSEPVVALGKVFLETHEGKVYAFGLK